MTTMTVMFNLDNKEEQQEAMDLTHHYICQNCMQNKKHTIYQWTTTLSDNKTTVYVCYECWSNIIKTSLIK